MALVHYVSYDRFPAPKGAAVHIQAFVDALQVRFGNVALTTVANSRQESPTPELNSFRSEQSWQNVRHVAIEVQGKNLLDRVAGFRKSLIRHWEFAEIAHFRSIYEGYPIARRKSVFCRKIVFEVNGLPSIELKYHYPQVADDHELLAKLRHQEQTCLEAADLVLTVSQTNAEHLISRKVPANKIRVIPNGVDETLFHFAPPRIVTDPLRMLYVGTLSSWQGLRVAIEALALYRRDFPAKLTVIGEGRKQQRESLTDLADSLGVGEHLEFVDGLQQEELVEHYHASHCAVAPLLINDRNRTQGCCPLKVLEAMSVGTPLIASDLPVVRCLARNGLDALLVRPGSAKAIKDAMLRLRRNPRLAISMTASARRRIKQHFTWRHAQTKLIEAYDELLEVSPSTKSRSSHASRSG